MSKSADRQTGFEEGTKATLPIIFVDFKATDLSRIVRCLNDHGFDCTPEQAGQLFDHYAPLPDEDHKLFWHLAPALRLDWEKAGVSVEDELRKLADEWKAGLSEDARNKTERRIMVVTNGLDEHPDWWDLPCICDECRSCA